MTKPLVMGLDGGGTTTTCVVLDEAQAIIAQATTGSTNRNSMGDRCARENLRRVIMDVFDDAALQESDIAAICLGVSGAGRAEDRRIISDWMAEILPAVPAIVHHDAPVALASGTDGALYGVVAISGTGMIVYGVNRCGETQRAGGWGPLLGDVGGGFAIGTAVLHAVTAAVDGSGPATTLTQAVLELLGLCEAEELIGWAYAAPQNGMPEWSRIAQLAQLAGAGVEAGDEVSTRIIDGAADGFCAAIRAVVLALGMQEEAFPLVLVGGNVAQGSPLATAVNRRIRQFFPAKVVHPSVSPAVGAALLALRSL